MRDIQPKHLLILGATGPSGLRAVELALAHLHTLTLYVRSPHKLPATIATHDKIRIVQGELTESDKLSSCFTSGPSPIDAVISALGPKVGQPNGNPITKGYEVLYEKMREHGVKRIILLSTISVSSPKDKFSLGREGLVNGIKIVGHSAWADVVATGDLSYKEIARGGLDITLARVPVLTNGKSGSLRVSFVGGQHNGWTLARDDLALFFVQEAEADTSEWIGEAPVLTSALVGS